MITYILCSSCFCEIWALCVSWITYDHLYYALCFACWALFGSFVPAMCSHTSCAQVHELPQTHCGDNIYVILYIQFQIYIYIYIYSISWFLWFFFLYYCYGLFECLVNMSVYYIQKTECQVAIKGKIKFSSPCLCVYCTYALFWYECVNLFSILLYFCFALFMTLCIFSFWCTYIN